MSQHYLNKHKLTALYIVLTASFLITLGISYILQYTLTSGVNTGFYTNIFWANITFMGDAFFAFGVVFFILFFYKQKHIASKLLVTILVVLMLVQVVKNILSGVALQLYFEPNSYAANYEQQVSNNIISSHSAIAVTLASFFILQSKNWSIKIALGCLAALVCYSRLYTVYNTLLAILIAIPPALIATVIVQKSTGKNNMYKGYFKSSRQRTRGAKNNSNYLPI